MSKLQKFIDEHQRAKDMMEIEMKDSPMKTVLVETIDSLIELALAVQEDYEDSNGAAPRPGTD